MYILHDASLVVYLSEYLPFLEKEYRLFPPVTIFVKLFPRAGYFFNAFDGDQRNSKSLIILDLSGAYSK